MLSFCLTLKKWALINIDSVLEKAILNKQNASLRLKRTFSLFVNPFWHKKNTVLYLPFFHVPRVVVLANIVTFYLKMIIILEIKIIDYLPTFSFTFSHWVCYQRLIRIYLTQWHINRVFLRCFRLFCLWYGLHTNKIKLGKFLIITKDFFFIRYLWKALWNKKHS